MGEVGLGLNELAAVAMPPADFAIYGRRTRERFPIDCRVRYLVGRRPLVTGTGRTVNISSTGLLFESQHLLRPGERVRVAIDWPATREGAAVELVATGEVIRTDAGRAAVRIDDYDFRPA